MAITQNTFTGNGSNLGPFSFTFKWLEPTDIKVTVGGVLKTAGTHYNLQSLNYTTKDGGQVLFTAGNAPADNATIRIYRDTDDSALSATFFSGSAIRAQDLNDDFTQNLYTTQEVKARYLDRQSGEMESGYAPNTSTSVVTKGYMETNYGVIDEVGFTRWRQTATAGQTTFSGTGEYGGVLSYAATREQVYINGALQQRSADYTANNGTSVIFSVGLTVGDVVDIVCINNVVAGTANNAADITYSGQFSGQTARTVASKLADVVSVKDFGAVGNGTDNDLAAVKLALESGKVVDGGGLSYAISGTLKPTSFKGLINATLIQTGNNTSTNLTTLDLEGLSNFTIQDVTINMGSNITTLFSDDGNNGVRIMGTQSGSGVSTTTTYVENITLINVLVTGNGCGTGIQIRHAKRFKVLNCTVRDRISGSSPDPTNDSQNGFQINNCSNFEVTSCLAYNLLTRLSGVNTNKWTRGFLFAEVRDCSITGCGSVANDQGFDFSGGVSDTSPSSYQGNRQFTITGCNAANNGTFGFKFANVTHDGLISGCIASNVANTGFVVSSQSTANALSNNSYRTQNLTFTGCQVVNSLNNGWSGYTSAGFYVDADSTGLYPRNIKFHSCSVEDNQTVVTTQNGFATSVPAIGPFSTGHNTDVTITTKDCNVFRAVTPYSGIHFPGISLTGSGSGSTNDSTWTSIDFNATDIYDTSGLHNPSSNADAVVIKESGLYFVSATVMYAITAAGLRKIRIVRNGASTGLEYTYAAHPTNYTTISATGCLYFKTGDTLRIEVWQNSGGSLSVERGSSFFVMARVA